MRSFFLVPLLFVVACGSSGSGAEVSDTPSGSDSVDALDTADTADGSDGEADADAAPLPTTVVPGPGQEGYDAALDAKASRLERAFRAFSAEAMGLNTDVGISDAGDRALVEAFLADDAAHDFAAHAGKAASEVVTHQAKVAGLYAGVGAAADAYRYLVLRDQAAPSDEIERARAALSATLDGLHAAVAITGAPGVIARGLARVDRPGDGPSVTPVPLFDAEGHALPLEKSNGTWRADFSADQAYPNLVWEDSVSRDMYIGWVAGYAAAWEAIRDDPAFSVDAKARLQADALAVARQLMVVRASGYDLEVPDADGRTTFHGWLNEHNLDGKVYSPSIRNGFHAIMALGCVAGWVFVTDDPELKAWLYDSLLGERKLHDIVTDEVFRLLDAGAISNYSNYNMAFMGAWLALRYLDDPLVRAQLVDAVETQMYDRPGKDRQPADFQYSLYDFVYAEGLFGASAVLATTGALAADVAKADAAVARGLQTLGWFPEAPYWDVKVQNCPGWDCSAEPFVEGPTACEADDGSAWTAMGCVGRNDDLITKEPFLMNHLPPSNYHWRSNPYVPNGGGDGSRLLPGVDFRFAYWIGRVMERPTLVYTIR
jgi:hypothetical protein